MWTRLFASSSLLSAGLLLSLIAGPNVMAADIEGFLVSPDAAARLVGPKPKFAFVNCARG